MISPSSRPSPVAGIKNTTTRPDGLRGQSVIDLVGRTPLLRLREITRDLSPDVRIWAKLEGFNPGGSVKDRPALHMLQAGAEMHRHQTHFLVIRQACRSLVFPGNKF